MPAKKVSPGTARSKKAAGLAQPILSFQSARPSTTKKPTKGKTQITTTTPSLSEIELENQRSPACLSPEEPMEIKKGDEGKKRQLDVKSKEWKGIIKHAKAEMGGLGPIHAGPDTHNDIHHVLRIFDLTSSYGPCVGITRLARWERAKKWGLNPPEEIRDILTTEQGQNEIQYKENVLYGWV
ncbi:uncharacterized protein IL334_002401 [Kwoniella shivajii]|uniref:DNA polymerase delta subunit 4 n=1 Tax=Kwoniella shivajii TaxID=564305 RepID=A0ABZ1CVA7_9TREE|nr:hypothetical protein IL334_002401 [Kwoniella shivajii]